jgi:hypothetical protein
LGKQFGTGKEEFLMEPIKSRIAGVRRRRRATSLLAATALISLCAGGASWAADTQGELIPFLPVPEQQFSTVPKNGDQNPYGVAFVPDEFPGGGKIDPGDILVSNFNNSMNQQGTGTTIVKIPPSGPVSLFFKGVTGLGLTTALQIFEEGVVTVGNLPAPGGVCSNAKAGSILVVDRHGSLVDTLADPKFIDGPWDSTVWDSGTGFAKLFVSNVLNGTVVRFDVMVSATGLKVLDAHQVASGYSHRCDMTALVVGPTGLVFDAQNDILYVASTEDNEVFAVHGAGSTDHDLGTGSVIYQDAVHLHGPLAMVQAPNGDLLVANSDVINIDPKQPSEYVEFTKSGHFVRQLTIDPNLGGSFGMAVATSDDTAIFAAVDDNTAQLDVFTIDGDFDSPF